MVTTYLGKCNGFDVGFFQPIRFRLGGPAYQCVDKSRNLLGLIYPNGRYDDPYAAGNTSWDLCEETEEHRELLRLNAAQWQAAPMEFVEVK